MLNWHFPFRRNMPLQWSSHDALQGTTKNSDPLSDERFFGKYATFFPTYKYYNTIIHPPLNIHLLLSKLQQEICHIKKVMIAFHGTLYF